MKAALVSMKRTPAEKQGDPDGCCVSDGHESPDYPWGLRLHLGDEQLAALGMTKLPPATTPVMLHAQAIVIGTSEETVDGGKPNRRLELQITDLAVMLPTKPAEDRMYPGMNAAKGA